MEYRRPWYARLGLKRGTARGYRVAAWSWGLGGLGLAVLWGLQRAHMRPEAVALLVPAALLWSGVLFRQPALRLPYLDLLGAGVDAVMMMAALRFSGGAQSPFVFLLYLKVFSLYGTNMYRWRPAVPVLFTLYGWLILLGGSWPGVYTDLALHLGGLALTALVGDLLFREFTFRETDPLTHAWNRRMGLDMVADRLDRGRPSLTVALVDLDRFKTINDRWGHRVGDEVLAAFAGHLLDAVRQQDVVIRLGGDEFLVVSGAPDLEARIRAVLRTPVETSVGTFRVDGSIGIARPEEAFATLNDLLDAVDRRMYSEKHHKEPATRLLRPRVRRSTG